MFNRSYQFPQSLGAASKAFNTTQVAFSPASVPVAATTANPPLAGQTPAGGVYQRVMSQLPPDIFGGTEDESDPTSKLVSKLMRWSAFRDMYENDPEVLRQRGQIYSDIQNELADKANARAMQGHLFAGLLNLPRQFSAAAERSREYLPYQLSIASQPAAPGFVTRQYATQV